MCCYSKKIIHTLQNYIKFVYVLSMFQKLILLRGHPNQAFKPRNINKKKTLALFAFYPLIEYCRDTSNISWVFRRLLLFKS